MIRHGHALLIFALVFVFANFARAQTCASAADAGRLWYGNYNQFLFCNGSAWVETDNGPAITGSSTDTCTSGGEMTWSASRTLLQVCNNHEWRSVKGVSNGSCAGTTAGTFKYISGNYQYCDGTNWYKMVRNVPANPGYFVRTKDTTTGNLGGLSGANTFCLNQLTTYNWLNKSDATTRGLLIAAKVKAFMCDGTTCQTPLANTTYRFALANNTNVGGAWFTTDASGKGPNDRAEWTSDMYFNAANAWHGGRTKVSSHLWETTATGLNHCNNWSNATTSYSGVVGSAGTTNDSRWANGTPATCDQLKTVICFVNP